MLPTNAAQLDIDWCNGATGTRWRNDLAWATDALAFKTRVGVVPNLWSGACVVMDNPAHKVAGIREAIEAVGATVVYLSPYSPDFSPIENCWAKIKEFLRARAARTYVQLDQAITDACCGDD